MPIHAPVDAGGLSRRDARMLSIALERARRDGRCRFRHAALIYRSGRVLSVEVNTYRNEPNEVIPVSHISIHAEEAAMRRCKAEHLRGATIYVVRVTNAERPALSRPCDRCRRALADAGVKRVVYT